MKKHAGIVRRLKRALERVAFASLIADIAISVVTVASLRIGQSYTIGIIFIINYILTVIVVLSLVLIALIAILSNYSRFSRLFSVFRFGDWS